MKKLSWKPLRLGIQYHAICGNPGHGPAAALLKSEPGAELPRHFHHGHEHILILTDSQHDDAGQHFEDTLVVNLPGSHHQVATPHGGIALVIWERPIEFTEE